MIHSFLLRYQGFRLYLLISKRSTGCSQFLWPGHFGAAPSLGPCRFEKNVIKSLLNQEDLQVVNPKNTPRYLINHLSLHFCFDKIDDLWFQVITSCHHQRLPEMVKTNLINIFDISTSGYIMILNL